MMNYTHLSYAKEHYVYKLTARNLYIHNSVTSSTYSNTSPITIASDRGSWLDTDSIDRCYRPYSPEICKHSEKYSRYSLSARSITQTEFTISQYSSYCSCYTCEGTDVSDTNSLDIVPPSFEQLRFPGDFPKMLPRLYYKGYKRQKKKFT